MILDKIDGFKNWKVHENAIVVKQTAEASLMNKEARVGVKKEPGYLYFVDKDGDVGRTKMARGGQPGGKAEKVAQAGVKKQSGRLYFVDKQGDISSSVMKRGRGG